MLPKTIDQTGFYLEFFQRLSKTLGITKLDDWYSIKTEDITTDAQRLLERRFDGSLVKALQLVYPQHPWLLWKFPQKLPSGFWDNKENQKKFLDWLGNELGFKYMEDWYKIRAKDIIKHGGKALLDKFNGSPSQLVISVYSKQRWGKRWFKLEKKIATFDEIFGTRDLDASPLLSKSDGQ
jgi:hypothetical protein